MYTKLYKYVSPRQRARIRKEVDMILYGATMKEKIEAWYEYHVGDIIFAGCCVFIGIAFYLIYIVGGIK